MLAKFKTLLEGKANKFAGNTDFLEAVCAACALIAIADGEIEDKEVEMTTNVIASNPVLSGAFSRGLIEKTADAMLRRAQGGRSGRMGLYREIEEVAADPDQAEAVYLAALDVSESDGEIEPEEKVVLDKIAKTLKVDPSRFEV